MINADFLGKGWKFPFTVKNGRIASAAEEDSIKESILIILGTAKGERLMRPGFGSGLYNLVFAPNNTSTATMVEFYVKEALLEWEPRIEVLKVDVSSDANSGNKLEITINYLVKSTNTKENLVYPFYLEGKK